LGLKVEIGQRLGGDQPRQAQVGGHPPLEAMGTLSLQQGIEDFDGGEFLFLSLFQDAIEGDQGRFHLEDLQVLAHPLVTERATHRLISWLKPS
jgi:hypothetical protein